MERKPKTILIVEDDEALGASIKDYLMACGYHVVGPSSTAEMAILEADTKPIDAAIVDVRLLGDIDGLMVGAELYDRGISIIFLSGNSYDRALQEGRGYAKDILVKPVRAEELLFTLEKALGSRAA